MGDFKAGDIIYCLVDRHGHIISPNHFCLDLEIIKLEKFHNLNFFNKEHGYYGSKEECVNVLIAYLLELIKDDYSPKVE